MFHRTGLLAVPLEDREAVLGPIGDHGERAHTPPVGEEVALALLDPHREVAAEARAALPMVAIVWGVRHFGPGPEGLRPLALDLPRGLGEADDLGLQRCREIGVDGVLDLLPFAPAEDLDLVIGDVGAERTRRSPAG